MAEMAEMAGDLDEVLYEITRSGNSLRVSAIDPLSNTEATVTGPLTSREQLKIIARRKLQFLLAKDENTPPSRHGRRRGILS